MELQKHSNGLGSELWVVEKRFPHGGVIFGLGITSWRSLKAARALFAWSIWCRRNKLRCNEPCVPLEKILDSAASLLTEF